MELPGFSTNLKIKKGIDFGKLATLGAPIGAIGVSLVILILIVWPKFSEALRLRASNAELVTRVGAMSTKVEILSTLDKVQLDSQLASAEQILPSGKAVFALVRQVEEAAARTGVLLNKVDVAPGSLSADSGESVPNAGGAAVGPAPKIQVRISINSDYGSLLSLLSSMYSISRVIGVPDFTISSGSVSGEPAVLRTSMVIDAYWKALPTELGSIETPVENLSSKEKEILARAKAAEVSAPAPVVPTVPLGRPDLFAPF